MKLDPAQEAISAALKGNWNKAVELNEKILEETSDDIEALNRLARAYSELGNIKKAKLNAQKVLKLDAFNSIATKCLKKWSAANAGKPNGVSSQMSRDARTFLEMPGKTKITSLIHIGDSKTIAGLNTGDELKLNARKHRVSVVTPEGNYVGILADNLSSRLRRFIQLGNEYEVLVKSIDSTNIKIFIREVSRSEKAGDSPSFPSEKIEYISFTPPELVHKKERVSTSDEDSL